MSSSSPPDTSSKISVLFVCTSNTCRSPMAECIGRAVLKKKLGRSASVVDVSSGGLSKTPRATNPRNFPFCEPHGSPAAKFTQEVMRSRGHDLTGHRSTILTPEQVKRAFRIYCVTESHREKILKYPGTEPEKVVTLGEDVPDPWNGTLEDYERAVTLIERIVSKSLDRDWDIIKCAVSAQERGYPFSRSSTTSEREEEDESSRELRELTKDSA